MAEKQMPGALKVMFSTRLGKYFQEAAVFLYRKSGGKLGGKMQGAPVLLLTTRGRKTGKQRTTPLIYLRDGTDLVVVASKGGWPEDPLWYRNLKADASVQVETGADRRGMIARTASDAERDRLWPALVAMFPDYAKYQSWSDRKIAVVVLSAVS
jgi:deazaflavin-dependent oxidoreductase (nitroreductase family)